MITRRASARAFPGVPPLTTRGHVALALTHTHTLLSLLRLSVIPGQAGGRATTESTRYPRGPRRAPNPLDTRSTRGTHSTGGARCAVPVRPNPPAVQSSLNWPAFPPARLHPLPPLLPAARRRPARPACPIRPRGCAWLGSARLDAAGLGSSPRCARLRLLRSAPFGATRNGSADSPTTKARPSRAEGPAAPRLQQFLRSRAGPHRAEPNGAGVGTEQHRGSPGPSAKLAATTWAVALQVK